MQLDVRERGFAYAEDAPLDMRMDGTTGRTAADVLNTYEAGRPDPDAARLRRGEVRPQDRRRGRARARARAVHAAPARLVELLYAEIPAPARRTGGHPAKRTFQALRMEVNDELAVLRRAIPAAIDAIAIGGRVVVESYHSLEDRLVKQAFTAVDPLGGPGGPAVRPGGQRAGPAPGHPGRREGRSGRDADNPRAASVRLRAVERVSRQGSCSMSSPAVQVRSRIPRIAGEAVQRARLTVVPRAGCARPAMPFVALVSMMLLGGVVGLLLFNTSMQQASFAATALESRATALAAREQALQMELDDLRDPQRVAGAAQRLGMVQAGNPAFLDLGTGKVIGVPDRCRPVDPVPDPRQGARQAGVARPRGRSSCTPMRRRATADNSGDTAAGSARPDGRGR